MFQRVLEGEVDLGPISLRARAAVRDDFHLDAVLPRIESLLALASRAPRGGVVPAGEIHRLARLAEPLAQTICQDARPA